MYKTYTATVLRIIDGNTIQVQIDMGFGIKYESKLKFLDFDAPETYKPGCDEEFTAGKKVEKYLIKRFTEANWKCKLKTYKKKTNQHNEILIKIFINNEDIIQTMKAMRMEKKSE